MQDMLTYEAAGQWLEQHGNDGVMHLYNHREYLPGRQAWSISLNQYQAHSDSFIGAVMALKDLIELKERLAVEDGEEPQPKEPQDITPTEGEVKVLTPTVIEAGV